MPSLPRRAPSGAAGGFTLAEILVASVVVSATVWGTMTALTTAAQIQRENSGPSFAEANGYALQKVEEIRNRSDADGWLESQSALGWQTDASLPAAGGSESILPAVRMYCVWQADCDEDGSVGDCYGVKVNVCWAGTSCPADGSSVNVCS